MKRPKEYRDGGLVQSPPDGLSSDDLDSILAGYSIPASSKAAKRIPTNLSIEEKQSLIQQRGIEDENIEGMSPENQELMDVFIQRKHLLDICGCDEQKFDWGWSGYASIPEKTWQKFEKNIDLYRAMGFSNMWEKDIVALTEITTQELHRLAPVCIILKKFGVKLKRRKDDTVSQIIDCIDTHIDGKSLEKTYKQVCNNDEEQLSYVRSFLDAFGLRFSVLNFWAEKNIFNYDFSAMQGLIAYKEQLADAGIRMSFYVLLQLLDMSDAQRMRAIALKQLCHDYDIDLPTNKWMQYLSDIDDQELQGIQDCIAILDHPDRLQYTEIVILRKLLKFQNRNTIKRYLQRAEKHLQQTRKTIDNSINIGPQNPDQYEPLSDHNFVSLFRKKFDASSETSLGKWNKSDIEQGELGYCFAYIANHILKIDHGFEIMIKSSLQLSRDKKHALVSFPLTAKNPTHTYRVSLLNINRTITLQKKDKEITILPTSDTSLGFKMLEIAFIKHYI